MSFSLLDVSEFVPPFLNGCISPPYADVCKYMAYLQKWREYLFWLWNDGEHSEIDVQRAVDDLIMFIMLITVVRQTDPTVVPTVKEIIDSTNNLTVRGLCLNIGKIIRCKLLMQIFDPEEFDDNGVDLPSEDDVSLWKISEFSDSVFGRRIPATMLGDFHQLCLDQPVADVAIRRTSKQRHHKGVYYTPAYLVDYLVNRTFEKYILKKKPEHLRKVCILDPSCGCGAFLIASFRYLLEKNKAINQPLDIQQCLEVLGSSVFGVDIDNQAVRWTRRLLLLTAWQYALTIGISKSDIRQINIPDLNKSIICDDFLHMNANSYNDFPDSFSLIIGGPPFVRIHELQKSSPEKVLFYKSNYKTAKGQFDLYMLFIEKATQLLGNRGYLGMSLPNTFLCSQNSQPLRDLISESCALREVTEFSSSNIYPNAKVRIALLVIKKSREKCSAKYIPVKGENGLRRILGAVQSNSSLIRIRYISEKLCGSKKWIYHSKEGSEILKEVERAGIALAELPVSVHYGIATGAGDVFCFKKAERLNNHLALVESRIIRHPFTIELSILRHILRGRDIKKYEEPEPKTMCIFPYDDTGRVIPEVYLRKEFPRAYKYLSLCKDKLTSRKMKKENCWYSFTGKNELLNNNTPKIVSGTVAIPGRFTVDEASGLLCSNSVLVIEPRKKLIDPYVLIAIFNSSIFRKWAEYNLPALGEKYRSYRVSQLNKFPLPERIMGQNFGIFKELSTQVKTLLHQYLSDTVYEDIVSKIETLVPKLYGLDDGCLV